MHLIRWITILIASLSILGNTINMIVFFRPVFNHHVCSWYLFVLAANNCLYSVTVLLYRILTDEFRISIISKYFSLCQFISYMNMFCPGLSHYLILFATIDRWSASSMNVRHRYLNSFKVMPRIMALIILFCTFIAIGSPIMTDFSAIDEPGCSIRATTIYKQFYLIVQLALFSIVAPLFMMMFMLLINQHRKMAGDLPITVSKCRKMEYHLTQILILLAINNIVLTLAEWIEYLVLFQPNIFGPYTFIRKIIRILTYSSYALPIIWYSILSMEFRRELGKMIPILAILFRRVAPNSIANNNAEENTQGIVLH